MSWSAQEPRKFIGFLPDTHFTCHFVRKHYIWWHSYSTTKHIRQFIQMVQFAIVRAKALTHMVCSVDYTTRTPTCMLWMLLVFSTSLAMTNKTMRMRALQDDFLDKICLFNLCFLVLNSNNNSNKDYSDITHDKHLFCSQAQYVKSSSSRQYCQW